MVTFSSIVPIGKSKSIVNFFVPSLAAKLTSVGTLTLLLVVYSLYVAASVES